MSAAASLHIIQSSEASARLRAAERWLSARADRGALIVSASRGAADDLARTVALSRGATAGLHRFSFAQLAARLAAPVLAARGIAPATLIGSEAVAARATFDARQDDGLAYFRAVAGTPGLPTRARADTPRSRDGRRRAGGPARAAARRRGSGDAPRGFRRAVRRRVGHGPRRALRRRVRGRCRRGSPAAPPARRADGVRRRVRAREAPDCVGARDPDHGPVRRPRDARRISRRSASRSTRSCPSGDSDLVGAAALALRRAPAARARGARRRAAVLGARRGARVRRDRPAHSRRSARRRALRRDGGVPALAARVPRPARERVRARRASTPGSIAARAGRTRPAAPSSPSSAALSNGCRRSASPSTSPSPKCRSR